MFSHHGSTQGYSAYTTLYPDRNLGIFTAYNTNINSQQRNFIHAYIRDVVVGDQTWFESADICAAANSSKLLLNVPDQPSETDVNFNLKQMDAPQQQNIYRESESRQETDYDGNYGHFFFGNVTIKSAGNLTLNYGRNGNFLMNNLEPDTYELLGMPPYGDLYFGLAMFARSNDTNTVTSVLIPALSEQEFVKDLKLHQTPPPNTENC